jgi:two-component system, NarL family, sensor histidine kinase BarA
MQNAQRVEYPTIDWELGTALTGGNEAMAKELFGMLLDNLPDHVAAMDAAYQATDLNELYKATHKFHGATCYCPTPDLKHALKELEISAKNRDLQKISAQMHSVTRAIAELKEKAKN